MSSCVSPGTRLYFLQKPQVFYSNNAAREAFVELCESEYVQKVTFDSYLYKKVCGERRIKKLSKLCVLFVEPLSVSEP